jgi:hypothetical protein
VTTTTYSETWYSVAHEPPPEGLVVQVQNNGGALLKRRGNLWFLPDDSMYVYYTPEFWRPAPGT